MLGSSLASSILSCGPSTHFNFSSPDVVASSSHVFLFKGGFSYIILPNEYRGACISRYLKSRKWNSRPMAQAGSVVLNDDERKTCDAAKESLSVFGFNIDEENKILGKAFGLVHSPYWGEERGKVIPKVEAIHGTLDYLRSLSLSDEDLSKLLKKFPEVLGCSLEDDLKKNVEILEKNWGIKGKSLRNLLLRNPKVLGFSVDCKGDCMALCTRCWVRF